MDKFKICIITYVKNIKRHFYNNVDYIVDTENQSVKLLPIFHKKLLEKTLWGKFGFKKIGGSSLGDVLLTDNFKSQFKAFCRISWIDLPILDRKYVDAGIVIEPMVLKKMKEDKNVKNIETFPADKYNYDYFKNKEIIGGLPDGLAYTHSNQKILIEVKTTNIKNKINWKKYGIPLAYRKQAQLYAHLMDIDVFVISTAFLDDHDYLEPSSYDINRYDLFIQPFKVSKAQVLDDIAKVKNFYKMYTISGVSPKYDLLKDGDLLEYLLCSSNEEWITLQKKWKNTGKIPN